MYVQKGAFLMPVKNTDRNLTQPTLLEMAGFGCPPRANRGASRSRASRLDLGSRPLRPDSEERVLLFVTISCNSTLATMKYSVISSVSHQSCVILM